MSNQIPPKPVRLAEFFRRLESAPAASDADEAYALVCGTMNAVEDELTGIPHDPSQWMIDGRMYPPQTDQLKTVKGRPELRRYVSVGHGTIIGPNGAIQIRLKDGTVVFEKPGADGVSI
jgi:hypothetical protein